MIALVAYIVLTLKPVNLFKHYFVCFFVGCVVPMCLAIVLTLLDILQYAFFSAVAYNILRGVSIVFNIIAYAILARKLSQMRKSADDIVDPLVALSSRLKYYPLCQVIVRLWPTIYEFLYGVNALYVSTDWSLTDKLALYGFVFCLPLGGTKVCSQ